MPKETLPSGEEKLVLFPEEDGGGYAEWRPCRDGQASSAQSSLGPKLPSRTYSVIACGDILRYFCTLLYRWKTAGRGPELSTEQVPWPHSKVLISSGPAARAKCAWRARTPEARRFSSFLHFSALGRLTFLAPWTFESFTAFQNPTWMSKKEPLLNQRNNMFKIKSVHTSLSDFTYDNSQRKSTFSRGFLLFNNKLSCNISLKKGGVLIFILYIAFLVKKTF